MFIQEIKPHICCGVREDYNEFIRQLTRKIYKVCPIKYTEERLGLEASHEFEDDSAKVSVGDIVNSIPYEEDEENDDDGISELASSKTKGS
jgi:hypothetical protein